MHYRVALLHRLRRCQLSILIRHHDRYGIGRIIILIAASIARNLRHFVNIFADIREGDGRKVLIASAVYRHSGLSRHRRVIGLGRDSKLEGRFRTAADNILVNTQRHIHRLRGVRKGCGADALLVDGSAGRIRITDGRIPVFILLHSPFRAVGKSQQPQRFARMSADVNLALRIWGQRFAGVGLCIRREAVCNNFRRRLARAVNRNEWRAVFLFQRYGEAERRRRIAALQHLFYIQYSQLFIVHIHMYCTGSTTAGGINAIFFFRVFVGNVLPDFIGIWLAVFIVNDDIFKDRCIFPSIIFPPDADRLRIAQYAIAIQVKGQFLRTQIKPVIIIRPVLCNIETTCPALIRYRPIIVNLFHGNRRSVGNIRNGIRNRSLLRIHFKNPVRTGIYESCGSSRFIDGIHAAVQIAEIYGAVRQAVHGCNGLAPAALRA